MAHRSWGAGFPNCQKNRIKRLVRRDGLSLHLREEVITLFSLLIDETERMNYEVRRFNAAGVPVTGGFSCRAIGETNTPSNHSWGLAIDINSDSNPQKKPLTTDIPVEVRQLWTKFGFRWGGTFSTPDPMHFEYMGSVSDAVADTARAQRELSGVASGEEDDMAFPTQCRQSSPGQKFVIIGSRAVPMGSPEQLQRCVDRGLVKADAAGRPAHAEPLPDREFDFLFDIVTEEVER